MKHRSIASICFILIALFFLLILGNCGIDTKEYGVGWPRWRGPNGDGISTETNWDPEALAGGLKVLWKVDVGMGHSNVAIKDNRLYTMGKKGKKGKVFCLNAETGKEIWQYPLESIYHPYPQSTPTIDGEFVYALTRKGILLCLKAKNGKLRWKKDLVSEYDIVKPFYEFAASPVIEGDLIILTANTSGIALDKKTGEKVWSSKKPPKGIHALNSTTGTDCSTPVIYDYEGRRYAVLSSYEGLHSVDVETGKLLWLYEWELYSGCHVADPLIFDNKVFITEYDELGGCTLLDIKEEEPKVLWKNLNMSSEISSPVMIDGYIYGCEGGPDKGFSSLRCLDVETGEVMWEEDFGRVASISLMAAAGKLIILNSKGNLHIAEANPEAYKEISGGDVLGGERELRQFWTPPVLYSGKIYCRNQAGDLVCLDVSK